MTKVSDETKQDKNVKLNAMPAFNLKMIDRFFLAVTKKSNGALTMVYTLGCNSSEKYKYDANSSIEIATFDNPKKAEIYYQTILAAIEFMKNLPVYEALSNFNEDAIKMFQQKTK